MSSRILRPNLTCQMVGGKWWMITTMLSVPSWYSSGTPHPQHPLHGTCNFRLSRPCELQELPRRPSQSWDWHVFIFFFQFFWLLLTLGLPYIFLFRWMHQPMYPWVALDDPYREVSHSCNLQMCTVDQRPCTTSTSAQA